MIDSEDTAMRRFINWLCGRVPDSEKEWRKRMALRQELRDQREHTRPKIKCPNCLREHLVDSISVTWEWGIVIRFRCPNDDPSKITHRVVDISQTTYHAG